MPAFTSTPAAERHRTLIGTYFRPAEDRRLKDKVWIHRFVFQDLPEPNRAWLLGVYVVAPRPLLSLYLMVRRSAVCLSFVACNQPTRSTQPCIHPESLNRVPASAGGKGWNVTSAGWQVTLCDPIWHVSSSSGEACCKLLYPVTLLLTTTTYSRERVHILYNGSPFSPQNFPFTWGSGPPSNTWFPQCTRIRNPNGISIGSAVFAWLATVTD